MGRPGGTSLKKMPTLLVRSRTTIRGAVARAQILVTCPGGSIVHRRYKPASTVNSVHKFFGSVGIDLIPKSLTRIMAMQSMRDPSDH